MRRLLLAVGLALGSGAAPAEASSFYHLDLPALLADTSEVVQVRVVTTSSRWSEDGEMMWTDAELKVIHSFAGGWDPGDVIAVREAGGTVADYTVAAIGFPSFRPGDELVVFVGRWEDGALRVAAGPQGFYKVELASDGTARLRAGPTQNRPDSPTGEVPGPLANTLLADLPARLGAK
jgi:hypothetical protein